MLFRLAVRNVKRQVGNYLIYFMTVAFTVAMLFAVSNIIFSDNLLRFAEVNGDIYDALDVIVVLISAVVAFVLSYAASFMLKLRKREFGTYLTLGMTRRNILAIFLSEMAVIGVLALGAGLSAGLFVYQGLSALMMNLLEMRFTIAAYSADGLALTIRLVAGIFLLASFTSAVYLRRASIYELLHGEKRTKEVRHPLLWLSVTMLSGAVVIGSIYEIQAEIGKMSATDDSAFGMIVNAFFAFSVSIILFHIGLSRSLVHLLLKRKRFCNRGSNTFVLRSLSGMLGSNSVMLGFLAFLLTFAVIAADAAFTQKASQEEILNRDYPYDVACAKYFESGIAQDSGKDGVPIGKVEPLVQKYTSIKSRLSFPLYTSGRRDFYAEWFGEDYGGLADCFMKLSDFNAFIEPLGLEPVTLADECMAAAPPEKFGLHGFVFEQNGKSYRVSDVRDGYPALTYAYFYVVVPDEAVDGMKVQTEYVVYDTEDAPYDAAALLEELEGLDAKSAQELGMDRYDYKLREYGRQEQNSGNAVFVIGALFVAAVFLFLAMAVLALKTLSGIADDKKRYRVLYQLGADEKEQGRTLFRQTFSFFMLPFAMPLFMGIPTAAICRQIMQSAGMADLMPQVTMIAVITAAVMAVVYLLYYVAAYQIVKRAVVRRSF